MYKFAENKNANKDLTVLGIPFRVYEKDGKTEKITDGALSLHGKYSALYFP